MKRCLVAMLFAACAAPEPVADFPASERELWTRSETIESRAVLSIAGLDREHVRDDGAASWSSRLVRLEPRRGADSTVYPFRLEVTNEAPAPVRLDVVLEARKRDGALVKSRRLPPLLVSPWQKTQFTGILRAPAPDARLVAVVQRTDEGDHE